MENTQTKPKGVNYKMSGGFTVGPILLVIALIGIVAAAIAFAGRGSTGSSATQGAQVNSAVIMTQGTFLNDGVQKMIVAGTAASAINFDLTTLTQNNGSTVNLFDPTSGAAQVQAAPGSVFATQGAATNHWYFQDNVKLNNVGTGTVGNYLVVLPGLSQAICEQINTKLYGSTATSTPAWGIATSTGSAADWESFAPTTKTSTVVGSTAIDDHAVANMVGTQEGCWKTSDGKYFYFKTVQIN